MPGRDTPERIGLRSPGLTWTLRSWSLSEQPRLDSTVFLADSNVEHARLVAANCLVRARSWHVAGSLSLLRQCRSMFTMQVFSTRTYERAIRKLLGEDARKKMEASIAAAPDAAPVIRGTGGIRKLRWAASGRGKRGGIRTVYFFHAGADAIYLLTAYAKSDREDLTQADTRALSRLVAAIRKEVSGR